MLPDWVALVSGSKVMDARKKWFLDQLDIDVWVPRRAAPVVQEVVLPRDTVQQNVPVAAHPAAAARALLQEQKQAQTANSAGSERSAVVEQNALQAVSAAPAQPRLQGSVSDGSAVVLDLWCLSSPAGVLLADRAGLDPLAQRLLRDIFAAAAGCSGASGAALQKITKPRQQQFVWPGANHDELPAERALRGYLQRLLQGHDSAFVLIASVAFAQLQVSVPPGVTPRLLQLPQPQALMSSGEAKRLLWRQILSL